MRKVLFAAIVSSIVLAVAPAIALARSHHHHHRGHHRSHRTHAGVRHEHFGSRNDENAAPSTGAQNAATVASFSNGVLTLALNDGSMVSGQVVAATEIKCEATEPQEMEHSRHADGDHSGGGSGGGDDNGEDNHDQGEDEQAESMCSSANLVPGAAVRDAELTISRGGAIWKEVELAG